MTKLDEATPLTSYIACVTLVTIFCADVSCRSEGATIHSSVEFDLLLAFAGS